MFNSMLVKLLFLNWVSSNQFVEYGSNAVFKETIYAGIGVDWWLGRNGYL